MKGDDDLAGAFFREDGLLDDLSDFFKVFGDPTRLKLLSLLLASPRCVGDLARGLGLSPSAVSHQLRTLKDARLVRADKSGQTVTYGLDDEHVRTILVDGCRHAAERRRGGAHG